LSRQKVKDDSKEKEYLVAYGQSLQFEIEEQEREVNFPIRESWIVMDILEHAREINAKNDHMPSHM